MRKIVLYIVLITLVVGGCAPAEPDNVTGNPATVQPPPTPPITLDAAGSLPAATVPVAGELLPTPTLAAEPVAADNSTPIAPTTDDKAILPPPPPPTATLDPAVAAQYTLSAAPGVPQALIAAAQTIATNNRQLFQWVDDDPAADVRLTVNDGAPLAHWLYVVAAPFATVADDTTWPAVTAGWASGSSELGSLYVDPTTAAALSAVWGPGQAGIVAEDFIGRVWDTRPSWIILPFEALRPEWKVIRLDGRSPLTHDFQTDGYALSLPMTVAGQPDGVTAFLERWAGPSVNRDPAKLTRIAMTGVTALVRATAAQMELRGILWPGEEVGPVLQSADIAHMSNEVSFAADCPYPDAYGGTTFCSRDPYFELIKQVGIDVIELTGNHLNDFGREPLSRTIDMYAAAGMQWFGGGRDLADAAKPALFEHNGNRIAFVGCNPVGPANDWALIDAAGSRPCGDLPAQIAQLRAEGYVVMATLQYVEHYVYYAPPDEQAAFSELAAAGASVVSGSQAHHAQGFAFENDTFIHYGPGNLFFDQMDMMGTRQTFVDTYAIYDGRPISVELWTGLIENWARPRVMTAEERADLLQTVFEASGW
ncbi:MAG: CapA family protein [Anaerolineales bacterium]|uniref:CapA family protein n=1 Tax=Promineifilum sp. TaxID=2664178 RepID=UPI001DEB07C9|nr:CapA family protein [Anaerolineales bacterium]